MVFGIFLGGLMASLLMGEFAIRHIPNPWMILQALLGGFLLGYGARLALGCNIGNFLSAWASAGLNALTFTAGMLVGVAMGTVAFERVFLPKAVPSPRAYTIDPSIQRALAVLVLAPSTALLALFSSPLAAVALAFGAIGYVSRLCWATGLRELLFPRYGGGRMATAVALSILSFALGTFALVITGQAVGFSLAKGMGQLQILIGGVLFGMGMGIAGACIFSSEWRAGAGSVYSMIVLASTIFLGMPILAYHYEWWRGALPMVAPNVSFYNIIGPMGIVFPLAFASLLILIANRHHVRLPKEKRLIPHLH